MAEEELANQQSGEKEPQATTPVIGIGASAGGVRALQTLFEALPERIGAAFVVIIHLAPDSHSELAEILAAHSTLDVEQVTATTRLKPDHVYVIPPDRQLSMSDHEISAVTFDEPRGSRAPIDVFFRSLALQRSDGCAVVLTGSGSDGAVGVRAIKEAGGIVLVQDPEEAEYPSMPRSAIATEVADFVLPINELAQRLSEIVRSRKPTPTIPESQDDESLLRRILAHLRVRTGHDFSHYKRTTVYRRVLRRMQVLRVDTLQGYFKHLRDSPEESRALLADLLISVTTFFRDPKSFEALGREVIPRILDAAENRVARVWIPGCASGEEAYSVAILLLEEAARREFRPDIQLFASDLDSNALAIAREGRYPAGIAADVSEERLRRFFLEDGQFYRVKRDLRDAVLFANHSLLKDPPFSRVDLITCRNLLIYLDRDMQQQVLTTLRYALNSNGYLFLGNSESPDHAAGLFRAVDREARIFQSTGRRRDELPAFPPRFRPQPTVAERETGVDDSPVQDRRDAPALHRHALESLSPPSILVDDRHRVIHLSETAGRFLQLPGGPLSADVIELVRQELRFDLRAALNRAFEQGEATLSTPLFVQFNGTPHRVHIQVKPVPAREREGDSPRALIFFVESDSEEESASRAIGANQPGPREVRHLQEELELMHTRLRTTREEAEASNEELRAANEELQSVNEEYRSTAEELETSREELQSINEELQTVNSELKHKVESVSRANSDLQNLMAATDVGTLFLDKELRIQRFTPRLSDLFRVASGDVGRPIADFRHELDYDELAQDARKVLHDRASALIEREVRSRGGKWYMLRLLPYRTIDNEIDGVVATFTDTTERRRMEDALRASEAQLKHEARLVELSRAPIFVWDFDDGIVEWNRGSEELYGYGREEVLGRSKDELLKTTVPGSSFDELRGQLLESGSWKGTVHHVAKDGRSLIVESHLELVAVQDHRYVLESTRDVTESKALEASQQLLVSELTHRVKNLMTIMHGMIHQTAKNTSSVPELVNKLDGRINALADSQKLIIDSIWEGADLRRLIDRQLAPYVGEDHARLKLAGESVILPTDLATPFGLVLHELATNAAKYGALSDGQGRVELTWSVLDGNDGRSLKVVWKELDGPPVTPPVAGGFGSQLIKQGLATANVEHEFLPEGIRCAIEFPLSFRSPQG